MENLVDPFFEALFEYGGLAFLLFAWVAVSVGSFLNVVIYRMPVMLQRGFITEAKAALTIEHHPDGAPFNLAVPRSHCPSCGHQITAMENIPLLSWILLRGRCRSCKGPVSARYPLIELLTLLLSLIVLVRFGYTTAGLAACLFTWVLVAATVIDLDTMLLPDQLTLPLLWLGLIVNLTGTYTPIETAVVGAVAGYLLLWTTYWGFKLLTGKEGMGYGDFKLLAALGAWVGWTLLPLILLLASVSGLVWALMRVATGRMQRGDPMPFGPCLAVAGWLALIAGESLADLIGMPY
jgi:leader peptidase (prepilin peptidase)/N-methyltransferase